MPDEIETYPVVLIPDEEVRNKIIERGDTIASITPTEVDVLKKLLDRDRTSRIAHGGLKVLLGFSDDELATLLGFLDRI